MPDDWRDGSLRRAALSVNCDEDIPAMFPDDSLAYLWDLAYALPRRGILFITAARDFISELALGTFSEANAEIVRHVHDLQQRKEDAVANKDFVTARDCRDQQDELRARLTGCPVHQITRDEIRNGLLRVGVDPDVGPTASMSSM